MLSASQQLATLCATLTWLDLPAPARERTKELVLDLLGVALRGSAEPSTAPVVAMLRGQPPGPATIVGAARGSAAAWAALANGTAAHAIEMDDVTTESSLHPGVAVIPAALAVAEERSATGAAFLAAVAAGYEVTMRVGNALNPASAYRRGFHPTGVAGAFGAAVAAGRLLGLDAPALTHAIGIAGTLAAGSLEYLSDGAWTKRLNAGWAAHAGVVAAGLAGGGFTGPATALEGRLGVLRAYTDEPSPERLLADLGRDWQVRHVSIKPYACCRYNHGLIDCVLRLRAEHRLEPEQVERVRLDVLSGGALLVADPIERKRAPANVVDAQFSAPFAAAVALARGAAGRPEYSQSNVDDPTIRALMARTDCRRDPALDALYPRQWPAAVEIDLRDGRTVRARVDHATGEPESPVPRADLVEKFVDLAAVHLPTPRARVLADQILTLDAAPNLQELSASLRVPTSAAT